MPTKLISTFNGQTQAAGAGTSLIIASSSLPTVQEIWGYCNGSAGTQYFLQIFNAATVPSNTSVPLVSLMVTGGNGFGPFEYTKQGWTPELLTETNNLVASSGLIICLSTTESTLTIGTGNVTMDCMVKIDSGDMPIAKLGETKVTTALSSGVQVVKADPSQNKLIKFTAVNNDGVKQFIALYGANPNTTTFGTSAGTGGSSANFVPQQVFEFPTTGVTAQCGFGWFVNQLDSSYTLHTGLYLAVCQVDANGNLKIPVTLNTSSTSTITSYYL